MIKSHDLQPHGENQDRPKSEAPNQKRKEKINIKIPPSSRILPYKPDAT
jgi:hypothetical protein